MYLRSWCPHRRSTLQISVPPQHFSHVKCLPADDRRPNIFVFEPCKHNYENGEGIFVTNHTRGQKLTKCHNKKVRKEHTKYIYDINDCH